MVSTIAIIAVVLSVIVTVGIISAGIIYALSDTTPTCDPGTFHNGTECVECVGNSISSGGKIKSCKECKNTEVTSQNKTECVPGLPCSENSDCEDLEFCNLEFGYCWQIKNCPAGSYFNKEKYVCDICAGNTVINEAGRNIHCNECLKDFIANDEHSICFLNPETLKCCPNDIGECCDRGGSEICCEDGKTCCSMEQNGITEPICCDGDFCNPGQANVLSACCESSRVCGDICCNDDKVCLKSDELCYSKICTHPVTGQEEGCANKNDICALHDVDNSITCCSESKACKIGNVGNASDYICCNNNEECIDNKCQIKCDFGGYDANNDYQEVLYCDISEDRNISCLNVSFSDGGQSGCIPGSTSCYQVEASAVRSPPSGIFDEKEVLICLSSEGQDTGKKIWKTGGDTQGPTMVQTYTVRTLNGDNCSAPITNDQRWEAGLKIAEQVSGLGNQAINVDYARLIAEEAAEDIIVTTEPGSSEIIGTAAVSIDCEQLSQWQTQNINNVYIPDGDDIPMIPTCRYSPSNNPPFIIPDDNPSFASCSNPLTQRTFINEKFLSNGLYCDFGSCNGIDCREEDVIGDTDCNCMLNTSTPVDYWDNTTSPDFCVACTTTKAADSSVSGDYCQFSKECSSDTKTINQAECCNNHGDPREEADDSTLFDGCTCDNPFGGNQCNLDGADYCVVPGGLATGLPIATLDNGEYTNIFDFCTCPQNVDTKNTEWTAGQNCGLTSALNCASHGKPIATGTFDILQSELSRSNEFSRCECEIGYCGLDFMKNYTTIKSTESCDFHDISSNICETGWPNQNIFTQSDYDDKNNNPQQGMYAGEVWTNGSECIKITDDPDPDNISGLRCNGSFDGCWNAVTGSQSWKSNPYPCDWSTANAESAFQYLCTEEYDKFEMDNPTCMKVYKKNGDSFKIGTDCSAGGIVIDTSTSRISVDGGGGGASFYSYIIEQAVPDSSLGFDRDADNNVTCTKTGNTGDLTLKIEEKIIGTYVCCDPNDQIKTGTYFEDSEYEAVCAQPVNGVSRSFVQTCSGTTCDTSNLADQVRIAATDSWVGGVDSKGASPEAITTSGCAKGWAMIEKEPNPVYQCEERNVSDLLDLDLGYSGYVSGSFKNIYKDVEDCKTGNDITCSIGSCCICKPSGRACNGSECMGSKSFTTNWDDATNIRSCEVQTFTWDTDNFCGNTSCRKTSGDCTSPGDTPHCTYEMSFSDGEASMVLNPCP